MGPTLQGPLYDVRVYVSPSGDQEERAPRPRGLYYPFARETASPHDQPDTNS